MTAATASHPCLIANSLGQRASRHDRFIVRRWDAARDSAQQRRSWRRDSDRRHVEARPCQHANGGTFELRFWNSIYSITGPNASRQARRPRHGGMLKEMTKNRRSYLMNLPLRRNHTFQLHSRI